MLSPYVVAKKSVISCSKASATLGPSQKGGEFYHPECQRIIRDQRHISFYDSAGASRTGERFEDMLTPKADLIQSFLGMQALSSLFSIITT